MTARAQILERVRAASAALPDRRALPEYPHDVMVAADSIDEGDAIDEPALVSRFTERINLVHGRVFTDAPALADWLAAKGATRGICDPALAVILAPLMGPAGAAFHLETRLDRTRIDDYHFGITRAAGAIAETGTIILTDASTSARLAALAPWIHVAVVARDTIHRHVGDAISALGHDPNVVWCTGPSKTADIEGILIEGVHGPGEQVALILPR